MSGRGPVRPNAREFMARSMSEADWQGLVLSYANAAGWWSYHPFDSRRSAGGWPDLTLVRGGELVFAELKKHDGKVSDEQARVIAMLEDAGAEVHVWRPQDEPDVRARLTAPRVDACRRSAYERVVVLDARRGARR